MSKKADNENQLLKKQESIVQLKLAVDEMIKEKVKEPLV